MSNVSRAAWLAATLVLLAAVPAMALTTVTVTQASLLTFDFGDTSSVTALNSSPGASGIDLDEAIKAANNTAGVDDIVIEIAPGLTISTLTPLTTLTRSHVTIRGDGTSTIDGGFGGRGIQAAGSSTGPVLIDDVVVDSIRFLNTQTAVDIQFASNVQIRACHVTNGIITGISVYDSTNVVVGGANPSDGNVVLQCPIVGISVKNGINNRIENNLVGVDQTSQAGLGCSVGITAFGSTSNASIVGNVICSSTMDGIQITDATLSGVTVSANQIGIGPDGVTSLGNATGIQVGLDATDVAIGTGNVSDANIIVNNGVGIIVNGAGTSDVKISNNSIFNNNDSNGATVDGIRLTNGGNGGIAAPVLSSVSPVVTGTAPASSVVEIFVDSGDQGETYLETVTADSGTGAFTGTMSLDVSPYEGLNITATATLANNTSQFSAPVTVVSTPPSVLSIARVETSPTNLPEVSFTVTFSEAVTGIETGALTASDDFALVDSVGAAFTNISGSGTTYTVTVSTGSGDGSVRLDVLQAGGIQDIASQGMAGDYTAGPAFDIVHVKFLQDLTSGDTVDEGEDVTLTVGAEGPGTLSYQWYHDSGAKVAAPFGPNAPSITLSGVGGADAGDYYVDVTSGVETETSSIYTLSVNLLTPVPVAGGLGLLVLGSLMALAGARRKQ